MPSYIHTINKLDNNKLTSFHKIFHILQKLKLYETKNNQQITTGTLNHQITNMKTGIQEQQTGIQEQQTEIQEQQTGIQEQQAGIQEQQTGTGTTNSTNRIKSTNGKFK